MNPGRHPVPEPAGRKTNLLILASGLWIGGAETVIRHLAETVDRRRFNVTLAVLKGRGEIGEEMARAGMEIVDFSDPAGQRVDYFTFLKLRRLIRERTIEVIHTHTPHGLVDATICKLLQPGLRVVHTFHFGNYPHMRPRIIWMERIFSRIADRLFAVGEVQRRQLRKVFGFRERSIATIWNGVTLPGPTPPTSFREQIGATDAILIGTIATLIEQKGLFDLLRVARAVRDAGHHVRFVVCGEGRLRPQLEALRAELGLDDVVVLKGWVTNAAETALPSFDIFFQPSLWEAMSVVILEAMAAGIPIVATRVGENPQIIDDGVDGLLADPRDVNGMAAALCRLIADGALRARFSEVAAQKVARHFTVHHMTRAYERVYLETLGEQF